MTKSAAPRMTEQEFLERCKTVYASGLAEFGTLELLNRWVDFTMRFNHTMLSDGQTQGRYVIDHLEAEQHRTTNTLANDTVGYSVIKLAAILSHPCQECAADKNAWHTRRAYCEHKKATA